MVKEKILGLDRNLKIFFKYLGIFWQEMRYIKMFFYSLDFGEDLGGKLNENKWDVSCRMLICKQKVIGL